MDIEIKEYANLNRSGALLLCLETTVELMRQGLMDRNELGLHDSYRTLTAVHKATGEIVGAIVFYTYHQENDIWLQHGCVKFEYRRFGIYRMLWNRLVEIAQKEGRRSIDAGSYRADHAIVKFNESVGREMMPVAQFHYEVPVNA
jgi:GNAT superfamily N-acetyltransferase